MLSAPSSLHALWLYALLHQNFNHACGAHNREVPVVFDGGLSIEFVGVRVALYRYFEVLIFIEHLGKLRQSTRAVGLHLP